MLGRSLGRVHAAARLGDTAALLFLYARQFREDTEVFECRRIALNLATGGDLFEKASHYFA